MDPLILRELHAGVCRFGVHRRGVSGITEKMLIQQLRDLEADGIIHREIHRGVPPRVEYSLTDLGASLTIALPPLGDWGEEHMEKIMARRSARTESATREPALTAQPRETSRTGRSVEV